jgi:hypothetical protein
MISITYWAYLGPIPVYFRNVQSEVHFRIFENRLQALIPINIGTPQERWVWADVP